MVSIGGFVLCSPDQNSDLSPVYENEALALVGHIRAKAATHDTVPSRQVHLIKLCLDDLGNIVQDTALSECESYAVNSMLLHDFIHICVLDHCIFSMFLFSCSMGLYNLSIGLSLPLLGLIGSSVRCNLCNCLRLIIHFSNFNLITNIFFQI